MIIQGIATALSTGMGCGVCCGSGISVFLLGYLTTHAGSMKRSAAAFLSFYFGKIMAVAAVCTASSLLGRQIMSEDGSIGNINIHVFVNVCMIAMGVWFIFKWIRQRNQPECGHCHHCGKDSHADSVRYSGQGSHTDLSEDFKKDAHADSAGSLKKAKGVSFSSMAVFGAGYGISPCAPLLLMAGYCATIQPAAAFLTGCIFALASAFAPMLLMMLLTGILSSKLYKEIPQYIRIFQLLAYILLVVIFAIDLL